MTVIPIVTGVLGTFPKGLIRSWNIRKSKMSPSYPENSILKIGQNTEKKPGDLKRSAVTRTLLKDNLTRVKNSQGVPLVRYSGPFLKRTREELKQMDQRTRKLITMYKALHPRDDIDRLYVSRRKGGRGLASIEDSIDASIQRLEDYNEKHGEGLITSARNDTDN